MSSFTITNGGTLPDTSNKSDFYTLIGQATVTVNGLVNADIGAGAGIVSSKLDLSSITQNLVMTSKILKQAKGADVASVAGSITLGDDGNYFDITGTNAITSITAKAAGTQVVLQFDSTASLVDGSNLKLNGNFQGAAESQIHLICDGTNWFEISRPPTATLSSANQTEMEAASSTAVYASPGNINWHPGVAKAWVKWNGTGTPAVTSSYNMDSSITDHGTGMWTLSITTDFSSANWVPVGMRRNESATNAGFLSVSDVSAQVAGSIRVDGVNYDGTYQDTSNNYLVCFGDQ